MINKVNNFQQKTVPQNNEMDIKLREVSKLYEKQFLREMVKAMRQTVPDQGIIEQNMAEKIFRSQLDDEYVEIWGDRDGVGLADIIYDDLINKFGMNNANKPAEKVLTKPASIIDEAKIKVEKSTKAQPDQSQFIFKNNNSQSNPLTIHTPWRGELCDVKSLLNEQNLLTIKHDNGLISSLIFNGIPTKINVGSMIEQGQKVGITHPQMHDVVWRINRG